MRDVQVRIRHLPDAPTNNRQVVGGTRPRYRGARPKTGSQIWLKLWHRIADPVVTRELKGGGFVDVSEGEGLEWIGPRTQASVKFCEALKIVESPSIVEFFEFVSKEYARSRTD